MVVEGLYLLLQEDGWRDLEELFDEKWYGNRGSKGGMEEEGSEDLSDVDTLFLCLSLGLSLWIWTKPCNE